MLLLVVNMEAPFFVTLPPENRSQICLEVLEIFCISRVGPLGWLIQKLVIQAGTSKLDHYVFCIYEFFSSFKGVYLQNIQIKDIFFAQNTGSTVCTQYFSGYIPMYFLTCPQSPTLGYLSPSSHLPLKNCKYKIHGY